MPRIGFGRWLLSWITKPLVGLKQSFEAVLRIVKTVAPSVTQSQVASSYRAAEKALDARERIKTLDPHAPFPTSEMTEETLGRPRRYLVTFRVQVMNTETGQRYDSVRTVYFMEQMSVAGYEAAYLKENAGDRYETGESIEGAAVRDVAHNAEWHY